MKKTKRINFGKISDAISIPNLIEVQSNSYRDFLQEDVRGESPPKAAEDENDRRRPPPAPANPEVRQPQGQERQARDHPPGAIGGAAPPVGDGGVDVHVDEQNREGGRRPHPGKTTPPGKTEPQQADQEYR